MKVLTLNFLTCAIKACKTTSASFPLHPKDCELVTDDSIPLNASLLSNLLPRLDWNALSSTASSVCFLILPPRSSSAHTYLSLNENQKLTNTPQLGFPPLPPTAPTADELLKDEKMQQELHTLLIETQISEGALVCGNCGHEYKVKEGIGNFLLPGHLV